MTHLPTGVQQVEAQVEVQAGKWPPALCVCGGGGGEGVLLGSL